MGLNVKNDAHEAFKLNERTIGRALTLAATQAALELNDYYHGVVPMLHGDLRGTATPDDSNVDYTSPYAALQFYGGYTDKAGNRVEFNNYTTPGTGPHWDQMIKDNPQKMGRIRQAYLKGLML